MKPAAKRLYGILVSFTLFLGALIVYSSLLVPAYREIQELRGEREALTNVLEREKASVAAVERLLRQAQNISAFEEALSVTLPGEEQVAEVVNQVQGIASSNEVLMTSLSMRPLAIKPHGLGDIIKPVGAVRISVSLIADYENLQEYLGALETNIRIMDVKSIRVGEAGTGEGPYNYEIDIDTYYQT